MTKQAWTGLGLGLIVVSLGLLWVLGGQAGMECTQLPLIIGFLMGCVMMVVGLVMRKKVDV